MSDKPSKEKAAWIFNVNVDKKQFTVSIFCVVYCLPCLIVGVDYPAVYHIVPKTSRLDYNGSGTGVTNTIPYENSLLVNRHFLTRLPIGWQLCCQPNRCHVRKLLLTKSSHNWGSCRQSQPQSMPIWSYYHIGLLKAQIMVYYAMAQEDVVKRLTFYRWNKLFWIFKTGDKTKWALGHVSKPCLRCLDALNALRNYCLKYIYSYQIILEQIVPEQ